MPAPGRAAAGQRIFGALAGRHDNVNASLDMSDERRPRARIGRPAGDLMELRIATLTPVAMQVIFGGSRVLP